MAAGTEDIFNATLRWYQLPLKCTKKRSCIWMFFWNPAVVIIVPYQKNKTPATRLHFVTWQPRIARLCGLFYNNREHTESDLAVKQVTTLSATKRPQGRSWQNTLDRREREKEREVVKKVNTHYRGRKICCSAWQIEKSSQLLFCRANIFKRDLRSGGVMRVSRSCQEGSSGL